MAYTTLTTAGFFNSAVKTDLINEAIVSVPELGFLPVKGVSGTTYKSLVRTALPTVGFKVSENDGSAGTASTYTNRTYDLKCLSATVIVDKAVERATDAGKESLFANEQIAHTMAIANTWASQLWYGTTNDANGFAGLNSQVDLVVDAGGSTANSASSVYVVCTNQPDNITLVLGQDGNLELTDVREQLVKGSTGWYDAYVSSITAWVGCQLGNHKSVVRIKNITDLKPLTDTLLYSAINTLPRAMKPTGIFMNRKSIGQLRASRTATNPYGVPAPFPVDIDGIPIFVTDAIVNTEAIA